MLLSKRENNIENWQYQCLPKQQAMSVQNKGHIFFHLDYHFYLVKNSVYINVRELLLKIVKI